MKKIVSGLIFSLLASFAYSDTLSCNYSMKINNEKYYDFKDYNEFIKSAFRPNLNKTPGKFYLTITQQCDKSNQSINIKFDSQTYILESINGHDIEKNLKRYQSPDLILDIEQFKNAFNTAVNEDFSNESKKQEKQNALKIFTFIFSDAARFEDITTVSNKLLTGNCKYNKKDYNKLIRSWKAQSEYIYADEINTENKYIGGVNCNYGDRYCLIAPIPHFVVEKFTQSKENEEGALLPTDNCF